VAVTGPVTGRELVPLTVAVLVTGAAADGALATVPVILAGADGVADSVGTVPVSTAGPSTVGTIAAVAADEVASPPDGADVGWPELPQAASSIEAIMNNDTSHVTKR